MAGVPCAASGGVLVHAVLQAVPGVAGRAGRNDAAEHLAGEKVFVDCAGATVPVVDAGTGEIRES